jgi:hypothetical protein
MAKHFDLALTRLSAAAGVSLWVIVFVSTTIVCHSHGLAQDRASQSVKKFHVSSVTYQENPEGWCGSGYCFATKIILKGFTKNSGKAALHYTLSCVAVVPTPSAPAETVVTVCPRLHANKDYAFNLYGLHEIDFLVPEEEPQEQDIKRRKAYALFEIDSESE